MILRKTKYFNEYVDKIKLPFEERDRNHIYLLSNLKYLLG